ncbi:MAG: LD-carboxypeptidase [Flaviaesturariibacter sp.]|nr:LD-carboxypeptidase [Flaviaesturariibacter sp.]
MSKIPPYLKAGDTIGITAPSGFMAIEKLQACIDTLQNWGYTVKLGETTHSESQTYFSGTDEERASDLQDMLDDPEVKAILCARGGYGMSRIVDRLNFKRFRRHPKWVIGFSDITVLHAHILRQYDIATLHAPMGAAFNEGLDDNPYLASFRKAIEGEPLVYASPAHAQDRHGSVRGELVGGNLSLIAHLVGSDSDLKTKNRILFLEDIGEHLYAIDRMMLQLKRSGRLDRLKGLVVGGFTDCKDTERPFGATVEEIIRSHIETDRFPVCFGFPVSHEKENVALKIGVLHQLDVAPSGTTLKEVR